MRVARPLQRVVSHRISSGRDLQHDWLFEFVVANLPRYAIHERMLFRADEQEQHRQRWRQVDDAERS